MGQGAALRSGLSRSRASNTYIPNPKTVLTDGRGRIGLFAGLSAPLHNIPRSGSTKHGLHACTRCRIDPAESCTRAIYYCNHTVSQAKAIRWILR
jgi:hypothetical protein